MAELDWAVKLSLTVGLCAGRLDPPSGWGDGGLQMCVYAAYALTPFRGSEGVKCQDQEPDRNPTQEPDTRRSLAGAATTPKPCLDPD